MYSNQNGPTVSYETWMAALASSACIGFTSLVPWLFNLTFFERQKLEGGQNGEDRRMKFLLSFAVGAILGDIFFHLIPESCQSHITEFNDSEDVAQKKVGLSIIAGIFVFIIVELILERWSHSVEDGRKKLILEGKNGVDKDQHVIDSDEQVPIFNRNSNNNNKDLKLTVGSLLNTDNFDILLENNNSFMTDLNSLQHSNTTLSSGYEDERSDGLLTQERPLRLRKKEKVELNIKPRHINGINSPHITSVSTPIKSDIISGCKLVDVAGYLNLIANGFDNFTHGLAIGASFLVSAKVGLLTTFVIFIHEIPHEICDYAILVNSGFSRLDAVKAQSSVSLFGLVGTATALYVKSLQTLNAQTVWILPFSAGGFLYIALVNLLPEILDRKTNFHNSLGQVACVILGIAFMAFVAIL